MLKTVCLYSFHSARILAQYL
uniref:Uncharacterized protein n=1 Tax=Anguilla anguilla TaxID=7936 RepID=A0A0E9Q1R3_ANGAN